jgi:hypothetical protein
MCFFMLKKCLDYVILFSPLAATYDILYFLDCDC